MKIFRSQKGAVSVFLVIILVPVMVVTSIFVDASRVKLSQSVAESAADLTLNTALTQYNQVLNKYYGLLGSSKSAEEFLKNSNEYFKACITSKGINASDAQEIADQISGLFTEDESVSDFLQIQLSESEGESIVKAVDNGNLANPALVKKELVEFMKYRAPVEGVIDLVDKFKKSSKNLENAKKDADMVDKKQKYYEREGKVAEQAKKVYDKIQEYKTTYDKEKADALKTTVTGLSDRYREYHGYLVEDLYNTDGKEGFSYWKVDLTYEDHSYDNVEADEETICELIEQAENAIKTFEKNEKQIKNFPGDIPDYNASQHHPTQYWVQMEVKLADYTPAFNSAWEMIEAVSVLNNASKNLPEDSEILSQPYEEGTIQDEIKEIVEEYRQKATIYAEKFNKYNAVCANILSCYEYAVSAITQEKAIIEQETAKISSELTEQYESLKKGSKLLNEIKNELGSLLNEVEKYKKARDKWEKSIEEAEGTDLSKQNQEELAAIKNGDEDFARIVTKENVKQLQNRVGSMKELLDKLKNGIDKITYGGKRVREISGYEAMKEVSKINESGISYKLQDLNSYVQSSFHFKDEGKISEIVINDTDTNYPSFRDTGEGELYDKLNKLFENYNETKSKEKEENYKNIQKDQEAFFKENDTTQNYKSPSASPNDIKETGGDALPSVSYAASQENVESTNEIDKVASFLGRMFTNFSETVSKAAVNVRDDFYVMEYVTNMFTHDAYENEVCYNALNDNQKKSDNPTQYYEGVKSKLKSEDMTEHENKTLTNKILSEQNNWAYQNEIEYILYGNSNAVNKASAYGTIFMIRFALNMPADFSEYMNLNSPGGRAIELLANGISSVTCGIIPAGLVKVVLILGITAAESAVDIGYLQKGIPVTFIKDKDDLFVKMDENGIMGKNEKGTSKPGFQYSEYLTLLLFLKLLDENEAMGVYARIADVIQMNMQKCRKGQEDFTMKGANVYYQLEATTETPPLLMKVPLLADSTESAAENKNWYTSKFKMVRGY